MKKQKKSIYHNPKKYAKTCGISMGAARVICKKYKKIEKIKKSMTCPCCGKRYSLIAGSEDVECIKCNEVFDFDDIKNVEYLTYGSDFDAVLYFSSYRDKAEGRMDACGSVEDKEWNRFVKLCMK